MENQETKMISVRDLFKRSISLLKSNLGYIFKIAVMPILAGLVLLAIGLALGLILFPLTGFVSMAVLMAIAGIIFIIIGIWAQVAMIYAMPDLGSEEKNSAIDIYKKSKNIIAPYFLVMVMVSLAALGGFVLLVVPGIMLGIYLLFSNYVAVLEPEHKGFKALARSFNLVRNNWWRILWRALVVAVLIWIVSFVLELPAVFFGEDSIGAFLSGVITSLINIFIISPFAVIYYYLLYKNIKEVNHSETISGIPALVKVGFTVGIIVLVILPITLLLIL